MTELDTRLVECPNGCDIAWRTENPKQAPRQFEWVEEAKDDIGTRRYCERCGTKLEFVEQ